MSRVRGCVYNRLFVGSCAACGELLVMGSPAAKEEATLAASGETAFGCENESLRMRGDKRYDSGGGLERWGGAKGRANRFWLAVVRH